MLLVELQKVISLGLASTTNVKLDRIVSESTSTSGSGLLPSQDHIVGRYASDRVSKVVLEVAGTFGGESRDGQGNIPLLHILLRL